jgi:ubiquitin-protein ligase
LIKEPKIGEHYSNLYLNPPQNCKVKEVNFFNPKYHVKVQIKGAVGAAFDGFKFNLLIKFNYNYPIDSPTFFLD